MVTQVSGPLRDVSTTPTRVREAWVVARQPRPQGGGLTTGEPAPATIESGVVSFEALPGPAILRLEKNGEEETHKLLINDVSEQTLEDAARAAHLADEHTQSELQRLAAQVAREISTIGSAAQMEQRVAQARSAESGAKEAEAGAQQSEQKAGEYAGRAETAASTATTIEQNLPTRISTELNTRLPAELDQRVPPLVEGTIAEDQTVVNAAAAAVQPLAQGAVDAAADEIKWEKPAVTSGSLDTVVDEGSRTVSSTAVTDRPGNGLGSLIVGSAGAGTTQIYVENSGRAYSRARTKPDGAWSVWRPLASATPLTSGSLDNELDECTRAVTSLSVSNLPEDTYGVLEVLPSSSGVRIQNYTTIATYPRTYTRRYASGSWTAWEIDVRQADLRTLSDRITGQENVTRTAIKRAPLEAGTPKVITGKHSSIVPMSMSRDRSLVFATNVQSIRFSRNFGQSWETISPGPGTNALNGHTVESITEMENGELIIVTRDTQNNNRRGFWITTGWGTDTVEVEKTFTARNDLIYFPQEWATSFDGRVLVASEYGPKHPEWQGTPVGEEDVARYVWVSLDYGKTWESKFDLIPMLSERMGLDNYYWEIHLHAAAWDPYWDRIWINFGDSRDGIIYSDDLGETWEWAYFTNAAGGGFQSVGIIPMPRCILFASDNDDYAHVRRIDRAEGKNREGHYTYLKAWEDDVFSKAYCRGKSRAFRLGDDAPALFIWSADTQAARAIAVATIDGWEFEVLWEDTETLAAGLGGRAIMGPTLNGRILASSVGYEGGSWRVIDMPAVGY